MAGFRQILKEEAVIPQISVIDNNFLQVGQLGGPILPCSHGGGYAAVELHNLTHAGTGLRVTGVGGLAQGGVTGQFAHQIGELLLQSDATSQTLDGARLGQLGGKGDDFLHLFLQRLHIGIESRVVKTLVNGIKIPGFVHDKSPFPNISGIIVHQISDAVNQIHGRTRPMYFSTICCRK